MGIKLKFLLAFFLLVQLGYSQERVKICFTLVVKNDEEVILNCLDSLRNAADCISICDCGSTDKTMELISEFLHETDIPAKIYHNKSASVRASYSQAIRLAQNLLKTQGYSLQDSYLLVIDPNFILDWNSKFDKENLKNVSYLIPERLPSCFRYAPRLLRADRAWQDLDFELMAKDPDLFYASEKLDDIAVSLDVLNLQKEILRLEEKISENSNHSQAVFDLAQCYRTLKAYEKAILQYKNRIALGGDLEEVWFSKYMIGRCFEEQEDWESALFWYLDAYQTNPQRAESLQKISSHYRNIGQNDLAHIFAKYGTLLKSNPNTRLADPNFSDYKFEEDLSIVSYYTQFKKDGFIAASDLLIRRDAPWWVKELAAKNILFYVKNLEEARYQPIEIDLPVIEVGFDERFHPMNPSIVKTQDGYKLICRAVNYTQTGAKIFNTIDRDGIFRTINFLVDLDRDFRLISQAEITEALPREKTQSFSLVQGLEDCRIFDFEGAFWFVCTTRDANPAGVPQIVLCRLDSEVIDGEISVEEFIPLLGPDLNRCEKNWLPFVKDGAFQVIYSYDPFVIYEPDLFSGECKLKSKREFSSDFSRFRGSAAPIEWEDGYLMLVHEVSFLDDGSRVYLHRFMELGSNFEVQKVSRPFTFKHNGVEYCCSMTVDHAKKELVLPIGIEDNEAFLCFLSLDYVRSLLLPVN